MAGSHFGIAQHPYGAGLPPRMILFCWAMQVIARKRRWRRDGGVTGRVVRDEAQILFGQRYQIAQQAGEVVVHWPVGVQQGKDACKGGGMRRRGK